MDKKQVLSILLESKKDIIQESFNNGVNGVGLKEARLDWLNFRKENGWLGANCHVEPPILLLLSRCHLHQPIHSLVCWWQLPTQPIICLGFLLDDFWVCITDYYIADCFHPSLKWFNWFSSSFALVSVVC